MKSLRVLVAEVSMIAIDKTIQLSSDVIHQSINNLMTILLVHGLSF